MNLHRLPNWDIQKARNRHRIKSSIKYETSSVLYNFIKDYNIKTVLETGISHGVSSLNFLKALPDNGVLVSIESHLLPKKEIIVSKTFYNRWIIIRNDSKLGLPLVYKLISDIELFFHDGFHTYNNMLHEYELAYKNKIKYIASHDVGKNEAWNDFIKKYNLKIIHKNNHLGICEIE